MAENNKLAVKTDVGQQVIDRVNKLSEMGMSFYRDYNYVNAIKASMLALQETVDKDGRPAMEVCTQSSVKSALFEMVTKSLDVSKKQAYFLVRGKKLCLNVSYFGHILQVKRLFPEWSPVAHVIREGDDFAYTIDPKTAKMKLVKHEQKLENIDNDFVGAYMYLPCSDGEPELYVMTRKQIMKAWSKSSTKSLQTHKDFDEKMALKGLSVDTLIPTPEGFTTMGEIQVGDRLYNALGRETTVIAKSEVKHLPCYEIFFTNGDSVIADEEHRWYARAGKGYCHKPDWNVLTTQELYVAKALGLSVVIPSRPITEFEEKELLIDPYVLGYWLGNGSKQSAQVHCHEDDADEVAARFEKHYDISQHHDERSKCITLNVSSKTGLKKDCSSLSQQLKEVGVYGNKHIPEIYMRGNIQQRIDLVRGLCDSDGTIDTVRGRVTYTSTRQDLTDGLYTVLASLGENVSRYVGIANGFGITTTVYTLTWQPKFNPFYLSRKTARFQERAAETTCPIKSIVKIDSVPTQCIAVDCGDATEETDFRKSFLFGEGFIPTHNTIINSGCTKVINATPDLNAILPDDEDDTQIHLNQSVDDGQFTEFKEVKDEQTQLLESKTKDGDAQPEQAKEEQSPAQEAPKPNDDEF